MLSSQLRSEMTFHGGESVQSASYPPASDHPLTQSLFPLHLRQSEDKSKTVLVEWGREGDHFDLQEQVRATLGPGCCLSK